MTTLFDTAIRALGFALIGLQLAGCGSGTSDSPAKAPVAWNVAAPSTPLSAKQQNALNSAMQQLDAGDATGAVTALTAIRSNVAGLNKEVESGLGLAYAARSGLSLSAFKSAAASWTATIPSATGGTEQVSGERGAYVAFKSLTTYDRGVNFALQLVDGNAALDMMAPAGTVIASLAESQQADIGMIATVQFLRLSTKIMQGNSTVVTPAAIDAAIAANYDAATRASLNRAGKLLTEANTALVKQETDGFLVALPLAITAALADGNITATELAVLMKSAITAN